MIGGGRVASFNRYSAACGLLALALAGCTNQTVAERKAEFDAAHAAPTAVVVKQKSATIEQDGLQHTADGYPSFNGPLTAANAQIDDKQAMDIRTRLTALGAQKKAGTITQAQYDAKVAEMKKLAAGQQDTLSEIQK
jgi:hypothetical protein